MIILPTCRKTKFGLLSTLDFKKTKGYDEMAIKRHKT